MMDKPVEKKQDHETWKQGLKSAFFFEPQDGEPQGLYG